MTTDWERFCKDGIFTIFVNSMVSHYYSLKFPFCHHYPMQILGNPSRRFSMNLRTVNVIPVIVNTGVIVPLISLMTKRYRKVRPRNIPCRRKKKKSRKGRRKVIKIEKLWQMQIVDGDVSAFSLALKRATGLKTTTESLYFLVRCHA